MSVTNNTKTPAKGIDHGHGLSVFERTVIAPMQEQIAALQSQSHSHLPDPPPQQPDPDPTRPFPPPVTSRTVTTPDSWDRTGTQPISGQVAAFLAQVPDGTAITWRPGSYLLTSGILLERRKHLELWMSGAKITVQGPDGQPMSPLLIRASEHIRIVGPEIVGGYTAFPGQQGEGSHALSTSGWYGGPPSSYIELDRAKARNLYGDAVYLEGENVGARRPSSFIWVHDCDFATMGRNGISFINATDVWFEDNALDDIAYHAVDIEQNYAAERVERIVIQRNRFGSYAHRAGLLGFFVSDAQIGTGVGALTGKVDVLNNTVEGNPRNGFDQQPRGLDSRFIGTAAVPHGPIRFAGNTSPIVRPSPVYAKDATVLLV